MAKILTVFFVLALFLGINPAFAISERTNVKLATPGTERNLILPPQADNSPVISLGTAIDPQSGKPVEGYAIIHKKGFHNKSNSSKGKGGSANSCYTYIGNGTKWKGVESWILNAQNNRGLDFDFIFNNITTNIAKWENATDGDMTNNTGVDVLGQGATTSAALAADTSSPDGQNEVYFADVSTNGTIAVTILWGIFSGPPFNRELVEWDLIFDDVDFDWSATGEAGKMDFENIATHELGHSAGMGDLYETTCAEETMYGYAANGETKKRDLNPGDITGINKLY